MNLIIEINGLEPLLSKLGQWNGHVRQEMEKAAQAGLSAIQESVPDYPQPSPDSTYRRTGTLGRTLGVGMGGEKMGTPDIYEVRSGAGYVTGTFGSRLDYATYVIGDAVTEQAWMHRGWWWTLPQGVWSRAKPKVIRAFHEAAEDLVRWMKGL